MQEIQRKKGDRKIKKIWIVKEVDKKKRKDFIQIGGKHWERKEGDRKLERKAYRDRLVEKMQKVRKKKKRRKEEFEKSKEKR